MIKEVVEEMTLVKYEHLTLREACMEAIPVVLGICVLNYVTVDYEKVWRDVQKVHLIQFLMESEKKKEI